MEQVIPELERLVPFADDDHQYYQIWRQDHPDITKCRLVVFKLTHHRTCWAARICSNNTVKKEIRAETQEALCVEIVAALLIL